MAAPCSLSELGERLQCYNGPIKLLNKRDSSEEKRDFSEAVTESVILTHTLNMCYISDQLWVRYSRWYSSFCFGKITYII